MSPVIGYASRPYGTAGLERAYDAELTGLDRRDPLADLLRKFEPSRTTAGSDPRPLAALQRAAGGLGKDLGAS